MSAIQYIDFPKSFEKNIPLSAQLKAERLKLFPPIYNETVLSFKHIKKIQDIDTPDFPLLQEACDYLDINFAVLNSKKANRNTGPNHDLFALTYYLRSRGVYTLVFMKEYIFTERNIYNYSRHVKHFINKKRYIDLFNYLDAIQ